MVTIIASKPDRKGQKKSEMKYVEILTNLIVS